ncbi:VCBS repeat-containing protein [Streptomyces sp. NA04227]|nr:VCBS repeat-containing protein [Streptomyces sp. NA04227]
MGSGRAGVRVRRFGTAVCCAALLLTACGPFGDDGKDESAPEKRAVQDAPVDPVPLGDGSTAQDDFNGDGARDLILNDLVKDDSHGDDLGIGVVYGVPVKGEPGGKRSAGLRPRTRQLLNPTRQAAEVKGQLPATFVAEAACDLDKDGFTDLVVSTDPPYDGQGQPPVPLQLLFGSPKGLPGKAVVLRIPAGARFGNDWPDQPVCGDFDGDGDQDLVVHATEGRLSFLQGPFTRGGAPREAGKALRSPGAFPTGPAHDVDGDGDDDLLVRSGGRNAKSAVVFGSTTGPDETGVLLPAGTAAVLGEFGRAKGTDAAILTKTGVALRYQIPGTLRGTLDLSGSADGDAGTLNSLEAADFNGDGYTDLVLGSDSDSGKLRLIPGTANGPSTKGIVTVDAQGDGKNFAGTRPQVLKAADFDGDGRADLVVRLVKGKDDQVAVYPGSEKGLVATEHPLTFTTTLFAGMGPDSE